MANPEHLSKIREGVKAWNNWRETNPDILPDLSKANLSGAKLGSPKDPTKAKLRAAKRLDLALMGFGSHDGANLAGADLSGADLSRADLNNAVLSKADLTKAKLNSANLYWTYLREAKLSGANLVNTRLDMADLSGADLSGATLISSYTIIYPVDLSRTNLSRARLRETQLFLANFRKAILIGADLTNARLHKANLSGAKLREAKLSGTDLRSADLSGADLSGANLSAAILVATNLESANLAGCRIHGISAWDLKLEGATQGNLVITRSDEPDITVDNLEVAQFIYMLLNHKKIRDVISTIGEKAVLILGRFTPARKKILDAIAERLRGLKYLPIIFDFKKVPGRDYTETVKVLAGLSRFVIADITRPQSIPQEAQAIIPHFKIPFVRVIQKGNKAWSMSGDLNLYDWVVKDVIEYPSKTELVKNLPAVVKLAEDKYQELLKKKAKNTLKFLSIKELANNDKD